jgi:hypothetical protein
LVRQIVVLDHRSLHALGVRSESRAEVRALLQNAVIVAGYSLEIADGQWSAPRAGSRPLEAAEGLYAQAEDIFQQHLLSHNRLLYVAGVVVGAVLFSIVGFGIYFSQLKHYAPEDVRKIFSDRLVGLMLFASIGTLTSVLMRLKDLDVGREVSKLILLISGIGRPFVAISSAVIAYLLLEFKLVSVQFGAAAGGGATPGSTTTAAAAYLVVAFFCGFSERFAQDLLGKFEGKRDEKQAPEGNNSGRPAGNNAGQQPAQQQRPPGG